MNQLTGKFVNVVLSVECGRGMEFLRNNVFITANFNGRILESDHIAPEENPPFNTELVWEIEKKELRKIRSVNLPLRVECITVDSQSRKERIGFALLSLRSAQIIPESKANEPLASSWYKLIGCQADKRKSHPELYLSLSLRDHLFHEQFDIENNDEKMPFIMEEDTQNMEETSRVECSVKYFENGHIQIGNENIATVPFVLNILVKDVVNLDALLPEALVFQTNSGSYFLTFKILGIIIKTKPFQKQMHSNITLNEKIVVNLLSKMEILEEFLHTQTITISFYYGYDKLGITKLSCKNVWNKNEEQHFFKFPSPNGIVPFGCTDKSPYITLETWIEKTEEPEELVEELPAVIAEEIVEKPKTRSIFSNIIKKNSINIEPDIDSTINTEASEIKTKSVAQIIPFSTKSVDTVIINEPLTSRPSTVMDVYEKFVIVVSLKYLVWITPPPDTKIMFKFLHPRAGSCTTIFTEISNMIHHEIILNNLYVRIGYISTMDKISKLLKHWYPKLVLADEDEIYISDQRPLNVSCFESSSKDYEIEFKNLKTGYNLARIGVNVTLKVSDARLEDDYETLYLLPIILDEIITVKEITDLMKWKADTREQFEKILEDKKQQELKRLEEEYATKKAELDKKVNDSITRCKELHNDLRNKVSMLKIEKKLNKMQNNCNTYDQIFQNNCRLYALENTTEVIELLSKTQRDNELLKKLLEEHQEKISQMEKSTSAKVETNILLQELTVLEEKFSKVQNAKSYFQNCYKNTSDAKNEINSEKLENLKKEEIKRRANEFLTKNIPTFYVEQVTQDEIIESTGDDINEY